MASLRSLLRVEPDEGRPFALMLAHSFCIGCARVFALTSAYALFLSEFGAQALPFAYIGISLFVSLVSLGYLKLSARVSFSRLVTLSVGFLLVCLLVFRLALGLTRARWLLYALPVWYEALWVLTNLEFWNLAGRLFNVRQAKRLFGPIGVGTEAGVVFGGLLAAPLVGLIGTPNLLLLAALSMAGVLGLLSWTTRSYAGRLAVPADEAPLPRAKSAARRIGPYVLCILLLVAVLNICFWVTDNLLYLQAESRFPGEDALARFTGVFLGVASLLAIGTRGLLTGTLLERGGVKVVVLLTPLLLLLTALPAALVGGWLGMAAALFWLVALIRLTTVVMVDSVDLPAINLLYQPLPPARRVEVQTMAEGIVYSLSVGLAGAGLSVVTALSARPTLPLLLILILFALAWLSLAFRAGRLYPRELLQTLTRRRLASADLSLKDAASLAVLKQATRDLNPAVAISALAMLESSGARTPDALLGEALAHEAPEVRRQALEQIEALGLASALPDVSRCIQEETDAGVRGRAVRCLAAAGGDEGFRAAAPYLDDPSAPAREGAIVGLLLGGTTEGIARASEQLLAMAGSPSRDERVAAARVLAQARTTGFEGALLSLMNDPELEVQRAALLAAGRVGESSLWHQVTARLGSPALRRAAWSALVTGGEMAVPAMSDAFSLPGQSPDVQARLARAGGRIGSAQAIRWLEGHMGHPNAAVRTYVLSALNRCAYQAQGPQAEPARRQIGAEALLASGELDVLRGLGGELAVETVRRALEGEFRQARERIFRLLAIVCDRDAIVRAWDNLELPSADRRATAMEVLDVTLSQDLKRVLFPLLAGTAARREPPKEDEAQEHAIRLSLLVGLAAAHMGSYGHWTRASALQAAIHLRRDVAGAGDSSPEEDALRQVAQALLDERAPLLAETAAWVIQQVDAREAVPGQKQKVHMLTIERVLALRRCGIFSETPDEALAEIAPLLQEVRLPAGHLVFAKGDPGTCLYLVAAGAVRVHDGENTLSQLGAGEVFGEMAALDTEPRMASVTTLEESLLLRLDQQSLYEIIADHGEVSRGIIRQLSHRLRVLAQEVTELRGRLRQPEP